MHVTSTCIRHKPELKGSTPQFVKYRVKSVNVDIRPENNQLDKKSKYDKRRLKQTTIKAHAKTDEHQDETLDKQLVNNNRQIEARKPTTEAETAKR